MQIFYDTIKAAALMHYQKVRQILIQTLALNWTVAAAKLFIGFNSGSLSILSDGLHSLFDGMSNILGLIGVKIAERPKDSGHPYGHRKFEHLAALGIAFLIAVASYEIIRNAVLRLTEPILPEFTALSFVIMLSALAVDFFVFRYENFWGRKLGSNILIADSLHTKTHFISTPSVIFGMFIIKAGYPIFDAIVTFFVIFLVLKMAWAIVRESLTVLCDETFVDIKKIEEITKGASEVLSSHHIRTRGDPGYVFLDMHITLEPNLPLEKAHQVSHALEEKIKKEIPGVKDVVIHMEPPEKKEMHNSPNLL